MVVVVVEAVAGAECWSTNPMIRKCREFVQPRGFLAVTELVDDFGNKMLVQTPILDANHKEAVQQAAGEMESREQRLVDALRTNHGHTQQMIDALKKAPGDCGCR